MDIYTEFDYLCNEPYEIDGIGRIRNTTLRNIRQITYNVFKMYINTCSMSHSDYLESTNLKDSYEKLSNEDRSKYTLYKMLLYQQTSLLFSMIVFFVEDAVELNSEENGFCVYRDIIDENGNNIKTLIGEINENNFDLFRNEVLKTLGLKQIDIKRPKYKTERARLLAEKIAKAKAQIKVSVKQDENLSLDNMIKKYCTHNKVGINILNVWDMTFYQFNSMFTEYNMGRQMDFSDMMAANTFSYKDAKDYKPNEWLKKINNDTD